MKSPLLMSEPIPPAAGSRALVSLASLVVIIAGLRAAQTIVVPLLLAVFFAMIAIPILAWLERRGLPGFVAVLVVVAGLAFVLVALGALIGSSADAFASALPRYQSRLAALMTAAEARLAGWGVDLGVSAAVREMVDFERAVQLAGGVLSRLAGFVSNSFLVLLTTVFVLAEATGFSAKFRAAFGDSTTRMAQLARILTDVHRYLIIKSAVSALTGCLLGAWVWMLGIDFPVLWGVLAFLLNYIPNLGSIMAAIPPVLLGILQPNGSAALALGVALGYLGVNVVLGSFVEPRLLGKRLGLSTLVVFLSLVFWGWVWGGVGMLLSVPLTMMVKILLEHSRELRWIAVLLDKSPDISVPIGSPPTE